MKTLSSPLQIAAAAALAIAAPAQAHDGHGLLGMMGSHWHASDAWGFAALAIAVAVALYLSRSGKP